MQDIYIERMDAAVGRLVRRAFFIAVGWPRSVPAFARLALVQAGAAKKRADNRSRGIPVPAFMIVSVTRRCNLKCAGCYSHATAERERAEGRPDEMDSVRLARVVSEGSALGVSFVLLAGGEPLVRVDDVCALARGNPRVVFAVFTNGTLLDDAAAKRFQHARNLLPILSVEGRRSFTDARRGSGVFDSALRRMKTLRSRGIFFGVSFTVMKSNLDELISLDFIRELHRAGAGIFFYNEYTPVESGTEGSCITNEQRSLLLETLESFRAKFPAIFLAFPGDEDKYGGCLSASRGFVHVAPDGRLEACPFAPFGDTTTRDQSLSEALKSPLLRLIREHHDELEETAGGCALWNRRDWAEHLSEKNAPAEASVFPD